MNQYKAKSCNMLCHGRSPRDGVFGGWRNNLGADEQRSVQFRVRQAVSVHAVILVLWVSVLSSCGADVSEGAYESKRDPQYEDCDLGQLEQQGARIVEALEVYKQLHGVYPKDFGEAGLREEDINTLIGPWTMSSEGIPGVGNYRRNGFAMWWDRAAGRWYLDM